MIPYIVKEMLRHIVIRLVLGATFVALKQRRPRTEYNTLLIKQQEREILISAALIGVSFGVTTTFLVFLIKSGENFLILIAGILLSIGLSQQIMSLGIDTIATHLNAFISSWNSVINLLAKQKVNPEWRFIENETNQMFIYPHILYVLPPELDKLKPSADDVTKYVDEHRWEVEHPLAKLYHDEPSLLSFAEHAVEYLRGRLHVYDRLTTVQQRAGSINPVVFIALGTLIWLLS